MVKMVRNLSFCSYSAQKPTLNFDFLKIINNFAQLFQSKKTQMGYQLICR